MYLNPLKGRWVKVTFAEALAIAMEKKRVKQSHIVKATGLSDAYVSMLVNGKIADPKFTTAEMVIHALGMSLDEFSALRMSDLSED